MPSEKLTALKVKALTKPGRYGDGGGLWLQVRDADRRSWLLRYSLAGKAREMGLGQVSEVGLAKARQLAVEYRQLLRDGIDPIAKRENIRAANRAIADVISFRETAQRYLSAHEASWKHPKHKAQWRASLENHVNPLIGDRSIAAVGTDDVMKVLEPIWHTTPETASRVRGRMEAILDFAKSREMRVGENPARWRGHIANLLPKRNRARSIKHYAALPWEQVAPFMIELTDEPGISPVALRFTILTAARTSEVTGLRWSEIDLQTGVWTVPASRMKAGREHRVPLSRPVRAILEAMAKLRADNADGDPVVFPGARPNRPLSNMAMAMALRRLKRADLTVHGFRSTFRDWVAETTTFPREVAEAALAHTVESKVEGAYRRGDVLEKRRRLMEAWATYCLRSGKAGDSIVELPRRGAA